MDFNLTSEQKLFQKTIREFCNKEIKPIAEKIDKNKAKYPVELVKGNYRKYTELKKQSRVR